MRHHTRQSLIDALYRALAPVVLGVACLVVPRLGRAAVIAVPADQPSIQQAVDVALTGDVIRVTPGTYPESVRLTDKTGITIEGADAAPLPLILGTPNKSADGIRADDSFAIVLRNLRIVGAYDGVRLNRVEGAVISGLLIEDHALGIRVNRGANNLVLDNTILGTRVEQGILVDGSPGIILAGNVIDRPNEEGIRVVSSPGAIVHDNHVSNSQGGNGITVSRSAGASVIGSTAIASYRDGFRIANSDGLVLGETAPRAIATSGSGSRNRRPSPHRPTSRARAMSQPATPVGTSSSRKPDATSRAVRPARPPRR
jgi:hypothetical protein